MTNENATQEQYNNQIIYNYADVANRFITLFIKREESLSHKKLQKLVYLAYGFYFHKDNIRLFNSQFEAWPHGPVCRELFFAIKQLDEKNYNPFKIDKLLTNSTKALSKEDDEQLNQLVEYVIRYFGTWTANELEKLTHKSGSAWDKIRHNENDENSFDIYLRDEDIKKDIEVIINESR